MLGYNFYIVLRVNYFAFFFAIDSLSAKIS